MLRGQSHTPLVTTDLTEVAISEPGAFDGGTANARGDHDGSNDPTTLFTVTGDVLVQIYGVCTTSITGAGTLEVGVTGNTAEIIAQVADTSAIAANEIIVDGTVDDVRAATFADVNGPVLITNGSDIIETLGTANLTAGEIYYVCLWRPITPGSKVEAA